jgi:CubicO group peptidase (beta-lactamase class C family)
MAAGRLAIAAVLAAAAVSDPIPARLSEYVRTGTIAGAVTLVSRPGRNDRIAAVGYQDLEQKTPMRPGTVFQIMSMTKPVTAVAIMMLADEGRLGIDDPVAKFLPEFDRRMTIRHLLTHTAGLSGNDPQPLWDERGKRSRTLAEVVNLIAREPLQAAPGARSHYSGPGFAVLGRIVEISSGQPLDRFLTGRIFSKLGMEDTYFFPPASARERIAKVYEIHGGKLAPAAVDLYRDGARYVNPAGGLYSTAGDMARFMRMTLTGRTPDGRRILSSAAVAAMRRLQPGLPQPEGPCAARFALGWQIMQGTPACLPHMGSGSYGHAGAFGTFMWADPARDTVGVFLIQRIAADKTERDVFVSLAEAER